MATLKVLGRASITSGSGTVGTVPGGKTWQLSYIAVAATDTTTGSIVNVHHVPSGGSINNNNMIRHIDCSSAGAKVNDAFGQGIIMDTGDSIQLNTTGSLDYCTVTLYGVEI